MTLAGQECVICGTIYISEADQAGREVLVPVPVETPTPTIPTLAVPPSAPEDHQSKPIPTGNSTETPGQLGTASGIFQSTHGVVLSVWFSDNHYLAY